MWNPSSWKNFKQLQQPSYTDAAKLKNITDEISLLPPLVFPGEIRNLREQLSEAGDGKRFILQGGDCAERFIDCNEKTIIEKIKILLQMSVVLTYSSRKPVIKIGRIAGQYSKPRSSDTEIIDGKEFLSYRGDSVNDYQPDNNLRKADPDRLLQSYFRSASTLNFIRAAFTGGFADLHHPDNWKLDSFRESDSWDRYRSVVDRITDAIAFMEAIHGVINESVGHTEFFTSHEGLLLNYEEAMTRKENGKYYNAGAHMLWIGERTRKIDSAHVEYFRGVENPIGIKFGPSSDIEELAEIIKTINPENQKGKIVLIHRLGSQNCEKVLPAAIDKIKSRNLNVVWCSDPMHGNTKSIGGIKTRSFDDILSELSSCFKIHGENSSILSGVHFELTGTEVTECIGGTAGIEHEHLSENYESYCDPRLNYTQSMEMAFLISEILKR